MLAKDMFFEKIKLISLVLCFSQNLYAGSLYEKIFNYNEALKNSSANFIQTSGNHTQEGVVFFGEERIKINYTNPEKITIILSEKKGVYINHDLKEEEFFSTKNNFIKIFYDLFLDNSFFEFIDYVENNKEIVFEKLLEHDSSKIKLKIFFENQPIILRKIIFKSENQNISVSLSDHKYNNTFEKNFFSFVPIYIE